MEKRQACFTRYAACFWQHSNMSLAGYMKCNMLLNYHYT